jgi:hypothetical protein
VSAGVRQALQVGQFCARLAPETLDLLEELTVQLDEGAAVLAECSQALATAALELQATKGYESAVKAGWAEERARSFDDDQQQGRRARAADSAEPDRRALHG